MVATLPIPPRSRARASSVEAEVHEHGLRVGALAGRIAEALGMSPAACRRLAAAAVPHDAGKASIPAEILLCAGPLDEAQLAVMRRHVLAGERLARRLSGEYGILAAALARSHHERFDGNGYPDGLSGDSIPLAVAIVSVADVFDALISDRPYRAAFSVAGALAIMRAERGSQFVPAVLDAFLERAAPRRVVAAPRLEVVSPPAREFPSATFRYRRADRRSAIAS